jgi:hypothetical protein
MFFEFEFLFLCVQWDTILNIKCTTKKDMKNPATRAHNDLSNGSNFPGFYKFFCFDKNNFAFSYSPNLTEPRIPTPINGVKDPIL